MKHVGQLAGLFSSMLLDGAASPELVQQGYTTEEERSASGLSQVRSACPLKCTHGSHPPALDYYVSVHQCGTSPIDYDMHGIQWKHPTCKF